MAKGLLGTAAVFTLDTFMAILIFVFFLSYKVLFCSFRKTTPTIFLPDETGQDISTQLQRNHLTGISCPHFRAKQDLRTFFQEKI